MYTLDNGTMTECTALALTLGRTEVDMKASGGKVGAAAVDLWCLLTGRGTKENGRMTKEMATARCTFNPVMVSLMALTTLVIGKTTSGMVRGR